MTSPSLPRSRLAVLDAVRGAAIVAMVVYHIAWDLYYLGFTTLDVTNDPAWVVFQRAIVTVFLLIVGISLAVAHEEGIRWRPFWRRFVILAGAALLTTAGTYIVFPEYFVYFGILHAIATFSFLGLAFVRLHWWVTLCAALCVLVLPAFLASPQMVQRPLSWIGFWPYPPMTTDIVPVFPWFGVVLLGIVVARLLRATTAWAGLATLQLSDPVGRGLRFLGRWSLLIYLVHQPLIFGGLSLIARPAPPDTIGFVSGCEQTCTANGGEMAYCARYCLCALEQVEEQDLWEVIATDPGAEDVRSMTRLCEAMATPPSQ